MVCIFSVSAILYLCGMPLLKAFAWSIVVWFALWLWLQVNK